MQSSIISLVNEVVSFGQAHVVKQRLLIILPVFSFVPLNWIFFLEIRNDQISVAKMGKKTHLAKSEWLDHWYGKPGILGLRPF